MNNIVVNNLFINSDRNTIEKIVNEKISKVINCEINKGK